jgi:sulfite dehydrogenase (cytochrome) subunit B
MTRAHRTVAVLAAGALAAGVTAAITTPAVARPVTYTLPTESSTLKKTAEPGYQRTELQCVTCHSRDYITTQPRGKGKEFWTAEVTKMVNVYAAPIPEPDRAVIADYLAANY